jgi:hypothetical protein
MQPYLKVEDKENPVKFRPYGSVFTFLKKEEIFTGFMYLQLISLSRCDEWYSFGCHGKYSNQFFSFRNVINADVAMHPKVDRDILMVALSISKTLEDRVAVRNAYNLLDFLSDFGGIRAIVLLVSAYVHSFIGTIDQRIAVTNSLFWLADQGKNLKTLDEKITWAHSYKKFKLPACLRLKQLF